MSRRIKGLIAALAITMAAAAFAAGSATHPTAVHATPCYQVIGGQVLSAGSVGTPNGDSITSYLLGYNDACGNVIYAEENATNPALITWSQAAVRLWRCGNPIPGFGGSFSGGPTATVIRESSWIQYNGCGVQADTYPYYDNDVCVRASAYSDTCPSGDFAFTPYLHY